MNNTMKLRLELVVVIFLNKALMGIRAQSVPVPKALTEDSIYKGCTKTKGCWGDRAGCKRANSCHMLVTYAKSSDPDYFQIELLGQIAKSGTGFVAMGLSNDLKMGHDSVVACTAQETGILDINWSINIANTNNRIQEIRCDDPTRTELRQCSVAVVKGRAGKRLLLCRFLHKKNVLLRSFDFNPGKIKYHLLLARGERVRPSALLRHRDSVASPQKIGLWETKNQEWEVSIYIQIHGCIMISVWIVLVPNAIFFARYFKETYTTRTGCCERRVWWSVHTGLMTSSICLLIVAMISILIYTLTVLGQWPRRTNSGFHAWIGGTTCFALFTQGTIGWFQPNDKEGRRVFARFHWALGIATYVLALINLCYAHTIENATVPGYAGLVVLIWVLVHIICHIVMSQHVYWVDKKLELNTLRSAYPCPMRLIYRNEAPYGWWRKTIFGIHAGLSILTAGGLIVTFILSKVNSGCDEFYC